MKILVTGGAGFIGSNLVDELINQGHDVVIIDDLSSGKKANLNPKAKFYEINIRDKNIENVFKEHEPDIVNHHAAQISVVNSVSNPIKDAEINIIGLLNILKNCVKYKVKKIINISSGGVIYGDPDNLPCRESYPFDPLSPYGIGKMTGEFYLNFYFKVHNLKFTSLRYSNVYGPRQDPHGEAGVIAIFSRLMLNNKQPKIFGNGKQQRDYIFVKDVVRANIIAMKKGDNQALNIGTGVPTSVNKLFKILKKLTGYKGEAKYEDPRPGELFVNYLDFSKAEKVLGWKPEYNLKKALKETVEWFEKN
jgi:UDP-glucose 4-epimerase